MDNRLKRSFWTGYFFISLLLAALYSCLSGKNLIRENDYEKLELASYIEPDFPFITTSLDGRNMGHGLPDTNVVARGLAIQLGNGAYACFDTDLLRWSVAWTGEFMSLMLSAQVSYADFFKENKDELPQVLGSPVLAIGMYPGASIETPVFKDSRPYTQEVEGWKWGPVPATIARWNGAYVYDRSVILSYSIGETEIAEWPGSQDMEGLTAFMRTIRKGVSDKTIFLNVAEVRDAVKAEVIGNTGYLYQGEEGDSVTAITVAGSGGKVRIFNNRYATVETENAGAEFTIIVWKGLSADLEKFDRVAGRLHRKMPAYQKGGARNWKEQLYTGAVLAPDTAAFVTDRLMLPVPNPWKRNVRVADIGFFKNGDAAVSTYDGDVWIAGGLGGQSGKTRWHRYASGLFEPMSIEVVNDRVYVFGKDGVIRLHDLNGDGEADYYENFCNLMQQSVGVREWAADMVADRDGNFFIAKGGHVTQYGNLLPYLSGTKAEHPWRASTQHSGSILKITPDGKTIDVIATGLRVPYLGINREKAILTASDQQGNFVPATPIYTVKKGDYFGVETARHREDIPEIPEPIVWMPHRVERSGASQTWVENGQMGPLNDRMIHFSFGRPGAFRVVLDSTSQTVQGGVVLLHGDFPAPVMKGEVNPKDGQLYVAGFNNYASNSKGISALLRLRYTGLPSYMINGFQVGKKGIVLSFDSELNPKSIKPERFRVKRWNYRRTEQYGSGHYKTNGNPGEELQVIRSSHLSKDGKRLLLVIPAMEKADQIEVSYTIEAKDGKVVKDFIWLTAKNLSPLNLEQFSVTKAELESEAITSGSGWKTEALASVSRGKELFNEMGCSGCHSPHTKTMGMYGPPLGKIFGTLRQFEDGASATVDDKYLMESILEPSKRVVKGYNSQMPSYLGILSDDEIQSLLLYISKL